MYKLSHIVPGYLPHSMIICLSVYTTFTHLTSALIVQVNYARHNMSDHLVPEELNFTLHYEASNPIHVCLKRVQHLDGDIPVYTLTLGQDGRHSYKREQLKNNKNIGYYQDVRNQAAIQVTREDGQDDHLFLNGELTIAGKKYTLAPEKRFRRNRRDAQLLNQPRPSTQTTLLDSSEPYNLSPQTVRPIMLHDYLEAPPELKRKAVEAFRHEVPESLVTVISTEIPLSSNSTPSQQRSHKRRRRQEHSPQNYFVDVVAVADFAAYNRFLAGSESRTEALQSLREYYAFIFNGVDLRYKSIVPVNYIIHVRLIKVIITETAAAGTFTEQFRISNRPWDEVDAQSVLSAFSEFAAGAGSDMLSPYDHAMLFTGYDLTSTLTALTNTNATTGLAFTSTLCRMDGKSVSVIEDLGGFQAVDTAAHELGHSLSARHDGDGNTCRSSDRYIMASGTRQVTQINRFNPWHFSPCSIASFTSFISSMIPTTRGETCLMLPLSITSGIPDVSSRLPGQEFSPDDQCRMIYGSGSRLCRGTEFGVVSNVCTSMFCFDPNTVGICYEQTAAMGTTCGDGKICLNGRCVSDARAPSVDDNCVFGDQPGSAFDERSCPDFVNSYSGYCYQALVRGRCCTSCKKVYRTVTGCEYGDKVRGCTSRICSFASTSYLEQCCGTCNYGSHFTTPQPTGHASQPVSVSLLPSDSLTTTQSVANIPHVDSGTCEDNPIILINDLSCADAIAANPKFCYETAVSSGCCASCDKASTGVAGTDLEGQDENSLNGEDEEAENSEEEDLSSQNYPQEDENEDLKIREEREVRKCKKEREVRHKIENEEDLEEDDGSKSEGLEEIMAKSYVELSIRINTGCEYGDRYPSSCRQAKSCDGIMNECCQTCATILRPSSEATAGSSTSAPTLPCTDQLNILVNNLTCATAIQKFPFYCYTNHVKDACCLSCKQKYMGVQDCEYGDRSPQKCQQMLSATDCKRLGNNCCSTCSSSAPRDNVTMLHPLLMLLCLHIFISLLTKFTKFI